LTEQESSARSSERAFKRRRVASGHGGSGGARWIQLIASERMRKRAPGAVALETLVATSCIMLLLHFLVPQDPLLIASGFGWIWLLPLIFSLRYGLAPGLLSGLVLLLSYYLNGLNGGTFPLIFFLGGAALVMVAGQFGDAWGGQMRHLRTINDYLNERLGVLTKTHFLLRLSHERLEHDLLSRPATLRDSLTQLRAFSFEQTPAAANAGGDIALNNVHRFLEVAAQSCQLERASVYAWKNGSPLLQAVASVGAPFVLEPNDLLVRYAIENRTLAHVQSPDLGHGMKTSYLAVVPLRDAYGRVIGLLVVQHMPFLALTDDNLQFLLVLSGYYADGVRHGEIAGELLDAFPGCPQEFALDFSRLARLQKSVGLESSLVALSFEHSDIGQTLFDHVQHSRRALDVQWPIIGELRSAILVLMPLSGDGAVDGFLLRIADSMQAQFGVDLESGRVSVNSMLLPSEKPAAALASFLRRCQLDV
jgi:hypothetical protein